MSVLPPMSNALALLLRNIYSWYCYEKKLYCCTDLEYLYFKSNSLFQNVFFNTVAQRMHGLMPVLITVHVRFQSRSLYIYITPVCCSNHSLSATQVLLVSGSYHLIIHLEVHVSR